ncbi:MAG TPA: VWA domain-containing protein [Chthonomonadaceae bacterium]|nr:VWA domain-containing protein [Chthonomonadaceae bacterium]
MRIERWFWLPIFSVLSLILHFSVVFVTRGLGLGGPMRTPEAPSIEVTFEAPATPPQPKRIEPSPKPKREPVHAPRLAVHTTPAPVPARHEITHAVVHAARSHPVAAALPARVSHESPAPREARVAPVRRASAPAVAASDSASPSRPVTRASETTPDSPRNEVRYPAAENVSLTDIRRPAGGGSVMHDRAANPLGDGMPNDAPEMGVRTTIVTAARIKKNKRDLRLAAGSARQESTTRASEISADSPSNDVAYASGGSGGPAADTGPHDSAANASVLHVTSDNPLGDAIPDDRPGGGAVASAAPMAGIHRGGSGGGPIVGSGVPGPSNVRGRAGFYAPDSPAGNGGYGGSGGPAVASDGPAPGGAGRGRAFHGPGSNPLGDAVPEDKPGAGPGSGGGLGGPGAGQALAGLRRGGAPRLGAAAPHPELRGRGGGGAPNRGPDRPGVQTVASNARVQDSGDSDPPPTHHTASATKINNVGRILRDAIGAPGRGALFELRPTNGSDTPVHIVYAMDTSKSMADGAKILKAKEALKKALGELRPTDTFNIITFTRETALFQDDAVPATSDNITYARNYVDDIRLGPGTNISGAMELALRMRGVTHIMVMSDGEPNGGIEDFAKLRRFIREHNTHNVNITTFALGLGEKFPGMKLLKAVADENGGTYDYVNMNKISRPPGVIQ